MKSVYRISLLDKSIHVEKWLNWQVFDRSRKTRPQGPASLAYALGAVRLATDRTAFELRRVRVNNGHGVSAKARITQEALRWERLGASVIGAFEVIHGDDLPAIIVILGWRDFAAAAAAHHAASSDDETAAGRRDQQPGSGPADIRGVSNAMRLAFTHEAYQ